MGSVYVWYQISSETKRLAHISQEKKCLYMWFQMSLSSHQPATRSTGEMSEMCANTGTGGSSYKDTGRVYLCVFL